MGEFEKDAKIESKRNRLPKALSLLAGGSLVVSALFFLFIVLFPIDVLSNWTLSIDKSTYALGDTANITSSYSKNYAVSGVSRRYLECKGTNNVYLRYLLNEAIADRQKKSLTGTGIVFTIPQNLPGLTLPTSCFFSISITYDSFPRIANPEYNKTKDFTLNPAPTKTISDNTNMDPSQTTPVTPVVINSSQESAQSLSDTPDLIDDQAATQSEDPSIVNTSDASQQPVSTSLIDTINKGLHNTPIIGNTLKALNL